MRLRIALEAQAAHFAEGGIFDTVLAVAKK